LGRKPHIKWEVSDRDIEITHKVLKLLNLEDYALRYTNELSGGELQKVIIARALVQEPQILLLDEPTNNLDLKNQLEVMKIIRDISKSQNIASIVVMHDLNLALRYSDKFIMLKDGVIYAEGGKEIINPENIKAVYGVDAYVENVKGIPIVIPIEG
jgi:iron complex transport system ATP-binding protein